MKPVLTIIIAVALSLIAGSFIFNKGGNNSAAKETAYERVMRTQTIRCGYFLWPYLLEKNANSGGMSGPMADFINEIGKRLDLKIIWATEINKSDYIESLNNSKIDAVCAVIAAGSEERRYAAFTDPAFYAGVDAYTRFNDDRFNKSLEQLNSSNIKIVSLEGSAVEFLSRQNFPNATHISIVNMLGASQVFLDVTNNKADALLMDQLTAARFVEANPNSLKRIRYEDRAISMLGASIAVEINDYKLLNLLNGVTSDMVLDGTIKKIMNKHGLKEGLYYDPTDLPFQIIQ